LLQPGTLKGNQFLLVSCANLFPFKQVDLIAKVLQRISNKDALIKWVHFGDGPAEKEVFLASKDLPSHIEFDYRGHVSNSEVIDFYKKHLVDLFISLSLKEGLPVSMMEAQSFGIPVLAFDIYGIPELVNEQTGILMDSASNAIDISQEIDQLISGRKEFDQNKIRQHFTEHFHAQKNYETFVLNLLATK
jgi:glycosyltransferase involved in cell wall biosynthesis